MLIGIGGLSRSGKTKLAKRVKKLFPQEAALLLHQDDYVKEESEIPMIRDHIDWEVPESLDLDKWKRAIAQGMKSHEVLIVEGLFAFCFPEISADYDKSILVEIPKEVFLERKRMDLRWGKEPEWYIEYIWDAYQIHGEPQNFEGYRLAGNRPLDVEALSAYLEI